MDQFMYCTGVFKLRTAGFESGVALKRAALFMSYESL